MEVVEAAAAQLETLKFCGTSLGAGQGEAGPPPDSVPVPEPPPPPQSDEGSPDTGQDAEAPLARERPPEAVPSAAVGGNPAPQLGPEPGGKCVTGPGAAERVPTADSLETSDSDSDSERSVACGPEAAGTGPVSPAGGSGAPGPRRARVRPGGRGGP